MGTVAKVRLPRKPSKMVVFIKAPPSELQCPNEMCSLEQYQQRYEMTAHRSASTPAIRQALQREGHVLL